MEARHGTGLGKGAALCVVVACALGLLLLAIGASSAKADASGGSLALAAPATKDVQPKDPGATWRQTCDGLAVRFHLGGFRSEWHEPARNKRYRGGTSWVRNYARGQCHTVTRNGQILHGPHVRIFGEGA